MRDDTPRPEACGSAKAEPAANPARRYSRALLDETIALWQPCYERRLTDDDARDIIDNIAAYFGTLMGCGRPSIRPKD